MSLHFSNGTGLLYDKDSDQLISQGSYQLIESDGSIYTRKRWWGQYISDKEIKASGSIFLLQIEDGRKGECILFAGDEANSKSTRFFYHFNGRGKLGNSK
ncbi:MAG: hypothetical protein JW954_05995 [Dehalococcoidaceae bacterium]|nr:hypothetical protein [Dehalococcoidaceae bacterium]